MPCASAPAKPTTTHFDFNCGHDPEKAKADLERSCSNEIKHYDCSGARKTPQGLPGGGIAMLKLPRAIAFVATAVTTASLAIALTTPALADTPKIDTADTAWMITATALVLMMTIPGLALFYAGMVRKKNVLATMAQSLVAVALISILWVDLRLQPRLCRRWRVARHARSHSLPGMTMDGVNTRGKDDSRSSVHALPDDVCDHHGGAGRRICRGSHAFLGLSLLFSIGWFTLVYVPLAHWVWGGGFLAQAWAYLISPAASSCI
jgi:Amt family ammonium transporter